VQSGQGTDQTGILLDTLNALHLGVLRLDADMHFRFANAAFIRMWHLPHALVSRRPHVFEMLMAAGDAHYGAIPIDERTEYFRWRQREIRAGAILPALIEVPDGRRIHAATSVPMAAGF
jgi:PAS domain-containing protein